MIPITTVEQAFQLMQSGNAIVVLRSLKTGDAFSYRVKENVNGKTFHVTLLTEGSPVYVGKIYDGVFVHVPPYMSVNAPAFRAFAYVHKQLCAYQLPKDVKMAVVQE